MADNLDVDPKKPRLGGMDGAMQRVNAKFGTISDSVTRNFSSFINTYPVSVMIVTVFLSVILIACSPKPNFFDPKLGFETRGTEISARVTTWQNLEQNLSLYPDATKSYYRCLPPDAPAITFNPRVKRSGAIVAPARSGGSSSGIIGSLFSTAADESPCFQLSFPLDEVEHFSQAVFEAPSWDAMFSMETIKELCTFQQAANLSLAPIRSAIQYPHFWSLPNYISCLNGYFSCDELDEPTLESFRKTLRHCAEYRREIIWCKASATVRYYWRDNYNCTVIPRDCQSKFYFDLFYFGLSTNIDQPDASPVYTTVVLPALQMEAYEYLGQQSVTQEQMLDVYDGVLADAHKVRSAPVRGLITGLKFDVFARSLLRDSWYVLAAIILVYIIIWLHSGSLFYTLTVLLSVALSTGVAYFVYHRVLRLDFFPFMNVFVLVLLVGIGADDTFLLKHFFDSSSRRQPGAIITAEELSDALSHAALSMFVCGATTAAAFFANLVSDIVVIKCFGVFAGLTMLVHYLFVVTWLPASLVVLARHLNPFCERICAQRRCVAPLRRMWQTGALFINFLLLTVLPRFITKFKYVLIVVLSGVFVGALVVVFYEPRLALPKRNPMRMFRPSNPLEWYDDRMGELFSFMQSRDQQPIEIAVVFGVVKSEYGQLMNPAEDVETGNLRLDPDFQFDMPLFYALDDVCQQLNNRSFIYEPIICFTTQFIEWSRRRKCAASNTSVTPCCNLDDQRFDPDKHLNWCFAEATKSIQIFTGGPILRLRNVSVDGFMLIYDANYTFSTDYAKLNDFYTNVDDGLRQILDSHEHPAIRNGWMISTFPYTMIWYDLERSLNWGTPVGVVVSIFVASIVAFVTMRSLVLTLLSVLTVFAVNVVTLACLILIGWQLNVVESILIILTSGYGFDFTLNYATAYQLTPAIKREQKVCTVLQYMGMPVLLAFLTTVVAGLVMLPSDTTAIYEIGLFMVLVNMVSWVYSACYFLSLLAAFGPQDCETACIERLRSFCGLSSSHSNKEPPSEMHSASNDAGNSAVTKIEHFPLENGHTTTVLR